MGGLRDHFAMVILKIESTVQQMTHNIYRLYDFYPDGQEDVLMDTMKMLKYTGDPWEDVFKAEVRHPIFLDLIYLHHVFPASIFRKVPSKIYRIRSLY